MYWYETGVKSSEGTFNKDQRSGLWLYYNEDGTVTQEFTYANGVLNGRETKWVVSASDTLGKEYEKFYKDGVLNGPATNWVNGFRSKMITYKQERPNGPWVNWYPESDQIKEQGFHKNKIRDGLTTYYYENGNKMRQGNIKDGKEDGKWTIYWEEGKIKV